MHSQRYPTAAFVIATAVLSAVPASLLYAASHPPTKVANAPVRVPLDDGDTLTVAPASERFTDSFGKQWCMAGFNQPPMRFMLRFDCAKTGEVVMFRDDSAAQWADPDGKRVWAAVCSQPGDRSTDNQPAKVTS
jgi:hypothetical protein